MSSSVGIGRRAAADLDEATEWYDRQSPGIGDEFQRQFEDDAIYIAEAPARWPIYHGTIRRFLMHRFPYVIYYDLVSENVRVLRVVHCSRDPEAIRRSLEEPRPR
jgi:toxin ParE1/3/4